MKTHVPFHQNVRTFLVKHTVVFYRKLIGYIKQALIDCLKTKKETQFCASFLYFKRLREPQPHILILQAFHINYKSVFHIAFQHSLVSFINVLHFDDLNIRNDIMLATEIQHLLGFLDAANQ